jgi:hypothetical protein
MYFMMVQEACFSLFEQSQYIGRPCFTMLQPLTPKILLARYVVSVNWRRLFGNGFNHFLLQFRSDPLVTVNEEYPLGVYGQVIQRPVPRVIEAYEGMPNNVLSESSTDI